MADVPWSSFAQGYAQNLSKAYDPKVANLSQYIQSLQQRRAGLPSAIEGLFAPAAKTAGSVGADIATTGGNLFGAIAGMGSSLPGIDPTQLAMAARQTGRAGATGAMLGNVLGTQVGQAQAMSTMEAQARLAEEQRKANEDLAQTQMEQTQAGADWMPYAQQRQQMYSATLSNEAQKLANKTAVAQLKMLPMQKRAAYLDNLLKTKQITAQDYENLASKYKLKQAGIKTGKKGSSGGGGGTPSTPQPSM